MDDSRWYPDKRMPATGATCSVGTTVVRALPTDQASERSSDPPSDSLAC
ncbi:hypothetical protein ACFUJX_29790 [Streptomyces rubiginosohelvolus]|nr:hypothetical protein [Streptomyces sp. NP10]RUP66686.1 hypothetical protein SSPNP10_18735 [Streptomyces sp. NP10]WST57554.1 hypothetical protein OG475_33895 [Streptomyces rubiginosohelvolus]